MVRLAANLTFLFTELPMTERFAAARRAGFSGVEVLFPYDLAARDLIRAARAEGLEFVSMNTPPPNWSGGPRGFAAIPGAEDRFRRDFDRALRFAHELGARHVQIMAGRAKGPQARQTLVQNLTWAAARAPQASLLIEPFNPDDMPGCFLDDFDLAAEILDEIGAPNLGLQFDAYHAQCITGDALACWDRHGTRARHVQIAGAPGRHEPQDDDIDFAAFFRRLAVSGYDGWISAEYIPAATTEAGLGWLQGVHDRVGA